MVAMTFEEMRMEDPWKPCLDEIVYIAREAIRNAFLHGRGIRIDVDVAREHGSLRIYAAAYPSLPCTLPAAAAQNDMAPPFRDRMSHRGAHARHGRNVADKGYFDSFSISLSTRLAGTSS
jgi:hypothetical protein